MNEWIELNYLNLVYNKLDMTRTKGRYVKIKGSFSVEIVPKSCTHIDSIFMEIIIPSLSSQYMHYWINLLNNIMNEGIEWMKWMNGMNRWNKWNEWIKWMIKLISGSLDVAVCR